MLACSPFAVSMRDVLTLIKIRNNKELTRYSKTSPSGQIIQKFSVFGRFSFWECVGYPLWRGALLREASFY